MEKVLLANRYRILKKLGEGGMGRIWKVHDTLENKELALKQYYRRDSDLSDSKAPTADRKRITLSTIASDSTESDLRFKQEFRTMVKLKHPNTVNVFDYGILESGDDYITMEIVSGEELSEITKKRRLSFQEIYKILIQICQVLNFIHSRLLVHRDIKPENIRITPDGNVKMMDFGLMDQMGLPSNGQITGTIAYLPPEVAQGGIIDARSDLYSLGCLAYELVAGHPPFTAPKIIEVIRKHLNETPESLKEASPDCPKELEEIILKLLAKNQNDRYQSTSELLNDLVPLSGEKIAIETLEQRKSYLNCSELIGRDNEMQKLKDAFSLTTQGKGQSIFIAAPAGVGKSRLLQEFKLKTQLAEIPHIEGQCFEQGMTPYQPLSDALKLLVPLTKKEIIDKYGGVLVKLIPELKDKGFKPAPVLDEVSERARLFEHVTGWLKEISKTTPFVICMEDLHWSDISSLKLLNACIGELKDSPIMILGAFRDDEVEPTSAIFQTEEEGLTHIMRLSTLNRDNVSSLIKGMLGRIELTSDFTEHLFNSTAGNAFFVSETIRALIEEEQLKLDRGCWILPADVSTLELPTSIEATITRRLNLLSSEALRVARISAVVGRNLDLPLLKSLSDLNDTQLFDILDELIERQFIQSEEKRYVFTHDRVRETLYAQLPEETRKDLHEKVGIIIETRFVDNRELVINELAYHFDRGLNKIKAVDYLIQAGYSLRESSDVVSASNSFIRVLEILDTIEYPNKKTVVFQTRDRLLEWAYVTDPVFISKLAERQFNELNNLIWNIPLIIKLFRGVFKIVDLLPKKLSLKIKMELSRQKPKKKIEGDISTILKLIILSLVWWCLSAIFSGNTKKSWQAIELSDKYIPDFNGPSYAMVTGGTVAVYQYTGNTETFRKKIRRSLEIFEAIKNYVGFEDYLEKYSYAAMLFEENINDALMGRNYNRDSVERAMNYSSSEKFFDQVIWCYVTRLVWLCDRGMYKTFKEEIPQPKAILKKMGRPPGQESWLYMFSAKLSILLHHYEKAIEDIDKLHNLASKISYSYLLTIARAYKAFITFKRGEKEKGIREMKEVIDVVAEANFVTHTEFMGYLAEMYLESGDIEQAEMTISQAEEFMKNFEVPHMSAKGTLYLLKSEVARRKREFENAQNILGGVMVISNETSNPLLKAGILEQKARINMDLTQWSSAKSNLNEAKSIYEELGADKRIQEIETLLKSKKELHT